MIAKHRGEACRRVSRSWSWWQGVPRGPVRSRVRREGGDLRRARRDEGEVLVEALDLLGLAGCELGQLRSELGGLRVESCNRRNCRCCVFLQERQLLLQHAPGVKVLSLVQHGVRG